MEYQPNINCLRRLYNKKGLNQYFEKDCRYLNKAFEEINELWLENYNKVRVVKFIMIAEAPLWGKQKKYIYNPKSKNSQFFHRSDLGSVLEKEIATKTEFLKICADLGLLIVDISPFALNSSDTKINYGELRRTEYLDLVKDTLPNYFERKLALINIKRKKGIKVFFRYARVKQTFQTLLGQILISNNYIKNVEEIGDVSNSGGGIDRKKLKEIIA